MVKRESKTKESREKELLQNTAECLKTCWGKANLPQAESDRENFEKAAQLITDFMDWHRIEESEVKFVGEKFFPSFVRAVKIQTAEKVSPKLLLSMGPDILDSVL